MFFICLFIILGGFGFILKAKALTNGDFSGWGWGGSDDGGGNTTGIGWISFNQLNSEIYPQGSIVYKINFPTFIYPASLLSGYAWSENIGWISFNSDDLSGCPDGNCVAERVGDGGQNLSGWARIIGIKNELSRSNSGDWQGWIKLSGNTQDGNAYGVSFDSTTGLASDNAYAWSDELGWISFKGVKIIQVPTLHVCEESCDSGLPISDTYSMRIGASKNVRACYIQSECLDTDLVNDVTSQVSWGEEDGNNAISLSFSSENNQEIVKADNLGRELVSVNYPDKSLSSNFTVNVFDTCPVNKCNTETRRCEANYTIIGSGETCPEENAECNPTSAVNKCADNHGAWKEVQP